MVNTATSANPCRVFFASAIRGSPLRSLKSLTYKVIQYPAVVLYTLNLLQNFAMLCKIVHAFTDLLSFKLHGINAMGEDVLFIFHIVIIFQLSGPTSSIISWKQNQRHFFQLTKSWLLSMVFRASILKAKLPKGGKDLPWLHTAGLITSFQSNLLKWVFTNKSNISWLEFRCCRKVRSSKYPGDKRTFIPLGTKDLCFQASYWSLSPEAWAEGGHCLLFAFYGIGIGSSSTCFCK